MEERGIIRGYATELDAAQIGFGLTAFVAVRTNDCCAETDKFLAAIPEVLEVHDVAGEDEVEPAGGLGWHVEQATVFGPDKIGS